MFIKIHILFRYWKKFPAQFKLSKHINTDAKGLIKYCLCFSYKVTKHCPCYASWVWTGYDPFKIFPSRYIIVNKCNGFVVLYVNSLKFAINFAIDTYF